MEIRMPQLGESVTEGTIARWLVQPGASVRRYQPLAEVITDKVNAELPCPADGTMLTLEAAEGATVAVGVLIATMAASGEEAAVVAAAAAASGEEAAAPGHVAAAAGPAAAAPGHGAAAGPAAAGPLPREGRYSPAVLRLAQEHGIDLARIRGTGLGGRITRKDVEVALAAAPALAPQPVPASDPAPAAAAGAIAAAGTGGDGGGGAGWSIPVDPVRRRIAEKMVQSRREAPHAWTMMPADVTGLVRLKERLGEEFRRREGISLSYMPFFIKAVVESLKEHPLLNSQWAGDQILLKREINISVAVATESALAVPVIKGADRLSIAGLNHAVADLADKARTGRLTLEDISGGTFTVNNTGAFGSIMSAPIINFPQAAILSFEAITRTPVVLEQDAIAIRSVMNLCLSLDHRILDGLAAARFLQAVKARLEGYSPETARLY